MEPKQAILLHDEFSVFNDKKGRKIIAKRGEKVELIADHGNVWVVKNKEGERFSVHLRSLNIT